MVERLQEPLKGTTFVDLDGTLISANSMHIFMRLLPGMLVKRGAIGGAIGSLWWNAMRSLRLISHRSMKWHLTKTARRHLEDSDWERIALQMSEDINPKVNAYIQSRRERGCLTYIATAAIEEYTLPLCRRLGFDGVLSTRFADTLQDYEELKGHAKHEAIERLLDEEQLRLESFLTDHTDDLPTAKAFPNLTIFAGTSDKIADEFRAAGITRYLRQSQ